MASPKDAGQIVFILRGETQCGRCQCELEKGDFICLTGEEAICLKYSGRVGRSAAAKQFDPAAVRLAVIAHVRHKYTKYDELLARYDDRQEARSEVRSRIDEILEKWEQP
ncbi:MAG: DUF2293 domain-containing protein [Thermoguttaceae bacterium]|jgi:hypothetical protein